MYVIFDRIDERGWAIKILQDNRHVAMERIANRIMQQWRAMLGAENEVDVQTSERLGHGMGRPFRAGAWRYSFTQGVALGWI